MSVSDGLCDKMLELLVLLWISCFQWVWHGWPLATWTFFLNIIISKKNHFPKKEKKISQGSFLSLLLSHSLLWSMQQKHTDVGSKASAVLPWIYVPRFLRLSLFNGVAGLFLMTWRTFCSVSLMLSFCEVLRHE